MLSRPRAWRPVRVVAAILLACALTLAAPVAALRAQDNLPPDVQFDVLRLEIRDAAAKGHHKDVLQIADRMRKFGQPMPSDTPYLEARAFHALGALAMARRSLATYLKETGRAGKDYDDAVKLFVRIKTEMDEKARAARAARQIHADYQQAHDAWIAEKASLRTWKERAVVFGGPGDDSAAALTRTPEGGIVVAGSLHVHKTQDGKPIDAVLPWITAFDDMGRRVWHRPLGTAHDAGNLRSVVPIPGRGYLYGGAQKGYQVAAITDRLGNMVGNGEGDPWIIAFAPVVAGEGGIARLLKNGDIVALGAEEIGKTGERGTPTARFPVIVRLSPAGKLLGKAVMTGSGTTRWYDVKDALVLDNGDLVIAGETRRDDADATTAEGYIIRVTPTGKEVWSRRIASAENQGMAITALAFIDGDIIAAGRDGRTLAYLRYATDGKLVWRRTRAAAAPSESRARFCAAKDLEQRLAEAPPGSGKAVAPADLAAVLAFACTPGRAFTAATAIAARPGGFLILGVLGRDGAATTRITMTAVGPSGDVVWEALHGDGPINVATGALATADGGFVVTGITTNWARDVVVFKTDGAGALVPFNRIGPKKIARPPAPKPAAAPASKPEAPKRDAAAPAVDDAPRPMPQRGPEATPSGAKAPEKGTEENGSEAKGTKKEPDPEAWKEPAQKSASEVPEIDLFKVLGDWFGEPEKQPETVKPER